MDENLLSMAHIPSDDILESLYKLRIRESGKLKTVFGIVQYGDSSKKAGPDYHRLKTMVKRSIEQTPMLHNLRIGLKKRRNGKSDVLVKQR